MKAEIIVCCEKGYLENTSKLLVYSIRNFGGIIKDSPIYAYRPREGAHLEQSTLDYFAENDVTYVPDVLNAEFPDYPFANKVLACAHREARTDADVLVFLDSDTIFMHSPDAFAELKDGEVLVRPVDKKNIATTPDFEGPTGEYWRELWGMYDIQERPAVRTTIDNKEILAYYNAGLIVVRTSDKLFATWKDIFLNVMRKGMKPKSLFFTDQCTLTTAIWSRGIKVKLADPYYNTPIHTMHVCKNPDYKVHDISKVVHAHYHKVFQNIAGANPFYNEFERFPQGRLLNRKIEDFGLIIKKSAVRYYLSKAKWFVLKLPKRLKRRMATRK